MFVFVSQTKKVKLYITFLFFGQEQTTYILETTSLLQKVLVISKVKIASTTGGRSTKIAKGKICLDPILANASVIRALIRLTERVLNSFVGDGS